MKSKLVKLLGTTLIISSLLLSVGVVKVNSGELPPTYGQATPAASQTLSNV